MLKKIFHILHPKVTSIGRMDYWCMFILGFVVYIFASLIIFSVWQTYFPERMNLAWSIFIIEDILGVMYGSYIGIKRFHDAGKSTAYYWVCFLLCFVVIGNFMLLAVLCHPSDFTQRNFN